MKKVVLAMTGMFMLTIFPCGGIWSLLSHLVGGGASETYLYPIYGGIILLTGLVVGCTVIILEGIKSLKEEIKKGKQEED